MNMGIVGEGRGGVEEGHGERQSVQRKQKHVF